VNAVRGSPIADAEGFLIASLTRTSRITRVAQTTHGSPNSR